MDFEVNYRGVHFCKVFNVSSASDVPGFNADKAVIRRATEFGLGFGQCLADYENQIAVKCLYSGPKKEIDG